MYLVGLTGGIGSGKSTVSKILVEQGIPVVDADVFARKVVEPGKPAWKKIKIYFGDDVIKERTGEIDRQRLGQIVFEDHDKRRKLNHIVHPEIYKEIFKVVVKYMFQGYPFVVLDLPLLFEHGAVVDYMHKIVVVSCEKDQQIERILSRDNADKPFAIARINSQLPLEEKARRANFVIDNSGTIEETRGQVLKMIEILREDRFHVRLRMYTFLGTSFLLAAMYMFIFAR